MLPSEPGLCPFGQKLKTPTGQFRAEGEAQSWAKPRGSVAVESRWRDSEAQSLGLAPCSGASAICSDGAEVELGRGGRAARA